MKVGWLQIAVCALVFVSGCGRAERRQLNLNCPFERAKVYYETPFNMLNVSSIARMVKGDEFLVLSVTDPDSVEMMVSMIDVRSVDTLNFFPFGYPNLVVLLEGHCGVDTFAFCLNGLYTRYNNTVLNVDCEYIERIVGFVAGEMLQEYQDVGWQPCYQ